MRTLAMLLLALAACDVTDEPIEGQVYLCTFTDPGTHAPLFEVDRCGPWDDVTVPADELAAEYLESGAPRAVAIACQGTRRACAREP